MQRARAAHVTVQRSVVTVTQEAIRVCGGRGLLKRYPLERYARDARAGALMRPWTQEIATQQAWEAALGLGRAGHRRSAAADLTLPVPESRDPRGFPEGPVERPTGFEPATSSLGSWHSATELRPRCVPYSSLSRRQSPVNSALRYLSDMS